MRIEFAALTNKGKVRKENQDSLFLPFRTINSDDFFEIGEASTQPPVCFAVFDGLGGAQHGKDASLLAAEMLLRMEKTGSLPEIFEEINTSIEQYRQQNGLESMGTTAAALVFSDDSAEICNIGDSGIYCFYEDRMVRLFENHSIQVGAGGKRYLTQYLGISSDEMRIEPFAQTVKLCSGYRFLLCSDGLTDLVSESVIAEIITNASLENACKKLFARAMQNGGFDNFSIILADLKN